MAGVGESFVGSESDAACERVGNKAAFEDWLDDIGKRVMDNAVAERRGRDETRFGVDDAEVAIGGQFEFQASAS